jgi:hypothetical protein
VLESLSKFQEAPLPMTQNTKEQLWNT